MSKIVTLNNKSFIIPEVGDQNYGEDLTAFFEELTVVLNSLQSPLDIIETDFAFTNNQGSSSDVTGLFFTTANIAGFTCDYIVTRDNGTTKITEIGELRGIQGNAGWEIARTNVLNDVNETNFPGSLGFIGVTFSITAGGQVQYTSNNYPGQTSGIITFRAKTISQ